MKPRNDQKDEHLLFERSKLMIMTSLATGLEPMSFTELLEATELTNGNLSSHLRKLEEAKMVEIKKQFAGRRPLTTVGLTEHGRGELRGHLAGLKELIEKLGGLS